MSPTSLFAAFRYSFPRFHGFGQQDAQECLRLLLEQIDNELSSFFSQGHPTIVQQCFGGSIISEIICAQCQKLSRKEDPFFGMRPSISPIDPFKTFLLLSAMLSFSNGILTATYPDTFPSVIHSTDSVQVNDSIQSDCTGVRVVILVIRVPRP